MELLLISYRSKAADNKITPPFREATEKVLFCHPKRFCHPERSEGS